VKLAVDDDGDGAATATVTDAEMGSSLIKSTGHNVVRSSAGGAMLLAACCFFLLLCRHLERRDHLALGVRDVVADMAGEWRWRWRWSDGGGSNENAGEAK
jgi:hypothetical protein